MRNSRETGEGIGRRSYEEASVIDLKLVRSGAATERGCEGSIIAAAASPRRKSERYCWRLSQRHSRG